MKKLVFARVNMLSSIICTFVPNVVRNVVCASNFVEEIAFSMFTIEIVASNMRK